MKTYLRHHTGKMENVCGYVLVYFESLEVSGATDVKNGWWGDDYSSAYVRDGAPSFKQKKHIIYCHYKKEGAIIGLAKKSLID